MNNFIQTRGSDNFHPQKADFEDVILNPGASFGGLYTLEHIPQVDFSSLVNLDYAELLKHIFSALNITLDGDILDSAIGRYRHFDDPTNPAPLVKIKENLYVQELYHGPTRAFKDMALQPFGVVFSKLALKRNKKYLILAATSGDTGPATLESFANQKNIAVVCLYPKGGTSDVQALQMTTQNAKNLKVLAIKGNFDDAQSILKSLLKDEAFKTALNEKQILLSAANSVNFGRIAFQIIYHIWGYLQVIKSEKIAPNNAGNFDKKIQIIVPSGNFGNALGAFYAKMMGLPIEKIIIASNANNILSEFIQTGVYDITNKSLIKTTSPAMDILKSSNIERVLFALFGSNRTRELMESLENKSYYQLSAKELATLQTHFSATFCTDKKCCETIKESFEAGYLLDPHTATALKAAKEFCSHSPTIICSTAEWTKFAPTITQAIFDKNFSDKEAIEWMQKQTCQNANNIDESKPKGIAKNIAVPDTIEQLFSKPIIHNEVLDQNAIKSHILSWLEDKTIEG
ncbi:threonine synthase [Helicobacter sp. 11S02596-1]|uniref:threonine synthase n=1 Tax=Helicobacter sp. 11S02596-1 TaxID=1476194 RepID=UPI000BA62C9C|nr:threonine synthase [Helicobacter sp. 11S02596-1]PAF42441.1 threonine synthase [Helicobacter sp. 11S02596-1]